MERNGTRRDKKDQEEDRKVTGSGNGGDRKGMERGQEGDRKGIGRGKEGDRG